MKYASTVGSGSLGYDPFGMGMVGRKWEAIIEYRYGFNGMENDDEIAGNDIDLDFGARIYDSRLGRFLSVDPLQNNYCDLSPYHFSNNNPIFFKDIDGKKFINPFVGALSQAADKVTEAQQVYDEMLENHEGNLKAKHIRKYQKNSGLKTAQDQFTEVQAQYTLVASMLYTLKKTNPTEYDYFDGLKDSKDKQIDIEISLDGNHYGSTSRGETEGLGAVYSLDSAPTAVPINGSTNKLIIIHLYRFPDLSLTKNMSTGYDYETFTNELGDIQFYFRQVHDEATYNHWELTASPRSTTNPDPNDPYFLDASGAGEQSKKYSEDLMKLVIDYTNSSLNEAKETYESKTNLLKEK